ncbi:MAG: AI-2E family transporter [Isosphaeraceae bacterium]
MTHGESGQDAFREGRAEAGTSAGHEFVGRALIVLTLSSLFGAAALLLVFAADVLLLGFAGLLLSIFLRGVARLVTRWTSLKEGWSLAVVVLLLASTIGLGCWFLASSVGAQFDELSTSLERSAHGLQDRLRQTSWGELLLDVTSTRQLASGRFNLSGRITGAFSSALGAFVNLVVILFVGLYVAVDPGVYRRGFLQLVPRGRRPRAGEVLDALDQKLGRWLMGRLFNMTIIGIGTAIGLWLLGIPLLLALALLAFLLDFIPYIGPIASAVPAMLVALTIGPAQAVYVGLLYLGVQFVESYLLTPLVQQRAVELPPAVTILAQLLLGLLAGVLGLALATPLTAAAVTMVRKLYVEDVLGDQPEAEHDQDGKP